MESEKIQIRTEAGQILEVEVAGKKSDSIWVVLGEGAHSIKCKLTPTRTGRAYAGTVMGREIVYERSVQQVREDLARHRPEQNLRKPSR